MRQAANFNPEWGYLAPAPNFLRTARIVIVATAVGATGGAAVVFSLLDRSGADESVATHTMAVDAVAAPAGGSAVVQLPQSVPLPSPLAQAQPPVASDSGPLTTIQRPTSGAALAESPSLRDVAPATARPVYEKFVRQPQPPPDRGPVALLRSSGAPANTAVSPPHGEY